MQLHPLILTVLLAAVNIGLAEDRSQELLERHIQWRGGQSNLENLHDITCHGKMSVSGLEGPLTVMQHRDGYRLVKYDLGVTSATEFVTPKGGWELNHSGQLDTMEINKIARQRKAIEGAFEHHLLKGEAAHVGTEKRSDHEWEVLRFTASDNSYTDLLIDQQSGALTWSRSVANKQITWQKMDDWRFVDGVRMFFYNKTELPGGGSGPIVAWEEIRINQNLTPGNFDPQKAARKVVEITDATADWIPVTLHDDRYLYVPCTVNGTRTELLLDSGAGITVLDKSFADTIGIKGNRQITARGTNGTKPATLASGVNIAVGEVKLTDITVAIIDLGDLVHRFGRSMPVILGKELFNNTVIDIDYPKKRVRFHHAETFSYKETGHSLELHPTHNGKRLIKLGIENNPPALFQIDTGSGACIDVFDTYTREQGLLTNRTPVSTGYGGGVGGQVESQRATFHTLDFAGYRMRNVPASFAPPGEGGFGTSDYAGNLGAGILTRFRVIFDFTRNRLHVEPGPGWDTTPFDKNRLGITTNFEDGKLKILHVAKSSPAEQAGLKPGDILEKVNGTTFSEDTWSSSMKKICRAANETPVHLCLADGREFHLMLSDYY